MGLVTLLHCCRSRTSASVMQMLHPTKFYFASTPQLFAVHRPQLLQAISYVLPLAWKSRHHSSLTEYERISILQSIQRLAKDHTAATRTKKSLPVRPSVTTSERLAGVVTDSSGSEGRALRSRKWSELNCRFPAGRATFPDLDAELEFGCPDSPTCTSTLFRSRALQAQ